MTAAHGERTGRPRLPVTLRPALAVTDRLRSSARLILVTVMLLVPGVVATWSFATAMGGQTDFAEQERGGVVALRPVLTQLVQVMKGGTPDLTAMSDLAGEHPQLRLDDEVQALTAASDPTGRIDALAGMATAIGNYSNLILDPDLDSFYVMDAQVVELPRLAQAAVHAAHPKAGDLSTRIADQAVLAGTLRCAADAIDAGVDTATANSDRSLDLTTATALATAGHAVADRLSQGLATPGPAGIDDLATAAGAAVDPLATVLTELLTDRIAGLNHDRDRVLLIALFCFLLGIWFAIAVWWRTRHDVGRTVAGVSAIAAGDLQAHPLPCGRDEMGDIGRALATARDQLAASAQELEDAQKAREKQLHETFLRQREAEKQSRERAREVMTQTAMTVVAELQSVVSDVEAVRVTAGSIDGQVTSADSVTRDVVHRAEQADRVARALGESLARVSGMAQLIAGVADQTKLLALNANIEAARAGEAGRGFGVVAAEVKNLAMTTAASTEQITSIIAQIERDAAEMTVAISGVAGSIAGVDEATTGLAGVAEEQRALVSRLDASVSETIGRLQDMDRMDDALERRGRERVPSHQPVELEYGGRTVATTLTDLSETGLGCRPPASPPAIGQRVEVSFEVLERPVRFQTEAVRLTTGERAVLGLRFVGLSPEEQAFMSRAVDVRLGSSA